MTISSTLRPTSTVSRNEQINRLLRRGYYPINVLPRDVLLRIPWEEGPSLSGIPKVVSDAKETGRTIDMADTHVKHTGTCNWGPVIYVVLWKSSVRSTRGRSMKEFALDIQRFKHDLRLQRTALVNYTIAHLAVDPARETLRMAIEGALHHINAQLKESP